MGEIQVVEIEVTREIKMTPALNPAKGRLGARVFENPHIGLKPTLFYDVELPLEPFVYEGELRRTSVRLDFINLGVIGWRELAGRSFDFPKNPAPGYIDGSIYLGSVHNPVDVGRIHFGQCDGRQLAARIELKLDFEYEGLVELGVVGASWDIVLEFDPDQLDAAAAEARDFKGFIS